MNDEPREPGWKGIIAGGAELLESVRPLWDELNSLHAERSPYFSDDYRAFSFEERAKVLRAKAEKGPFRVSVQRKGGVVQGYVIASLEGSVGEIDSICVTKAARGTGMGAALMEDCLAWLKQNDAEKVRVVVAYGNEKAFGFYARFGLFPRATTLTTLRWHTGGKGDRT